VAAARKFENVAENRVVGSGNLRPDMVLRRKSDGKTYIVDVTIPFDNRMAAFKAVAEEKATKYGDLAKEMPREQPAEVVPFNVGALRAWDSANDSFMTKLCSRSYATQIRKLCVSDVIAFSREIYVEPSLVHANANCNRLRWAPPYFHLLIFIFSVSMFSVFF